MNDEVAKIAAWSVAWEGSLSIVNGGSVSRRRLASGEIRKYEGHKSYLKPYIAVANTNRDLLEEFQLLVGMGSIRCYKPTNPAHKDSYIWIVRTIKDCLEFCEAILPWLPAKQRQAELVIEFCSGGLPTRSFRDTDRDWEIYEEMKKLNKRGKELWLREEE